MISLALEVALVAEVVAVPIEAPQPELEGRSRFHLEVSARVMAVLVQLQPEDGLAARLKAMRHEGSAALEGEREYGRWAPS